MGNGSLPGRRAERTAVPSQQAGLPLAAVTFRLVFGPDSRIIPGLARPGKERRRNGIPPVVAMQVQQKILLCYTSW